MNLGALTIAAKRVQALIGANSPVLLTAAGVTGVLATAYLTAKATFQASSILRNAETEANMERLGDDEVSREERSDRLSSWMAEVQGGTYVCPLELREKAALVWKCYIPPALCLVGTIAAIVTANRIDTKRALAAASAYGLSERAFSEYKDRVKEKIGDRKEQAVRDDIIQDQARRHPESRDVYVGPGDVLCFDTWSGRFFASNRQKIERALNDLNFRLNNQTYESVSDFYDLLDIPKNDVSDHLGWSSEKQVVLYFSSGLVDESRPYLSFSFETMPKPNYRYNH